MPGNNSYTKLLLHMDGPDGSQVFPDDSFGNTAVDKLLAYSGVVFKSDAITLQCSCEIDSTHILVVFADTNNSNYGTARYLSYDPETEIITASADYVFFPDAVPALLSVCKMDTNHFIVLFDDVNDAHKTKAICLKLLSGSFSNGTALLVETGRSNTTLAVSGFNATYALAAYGDAGNNDYGTVRCIQRSGTSLTCGNALVFSDNDTAQYINASSMTSLQAIVTYRDSGISDGRAVCIYRTSETSTTLNKGSTVVYEDTYSPSTSTNALLALNTTYAVIGYRGTPALAFAKLLSLSGTTVTAYDRVPVVSATGSNCIALGYFSETKLGYAYLSGSVPYCIELTRSGTTLSVSTSAKALSGTTYVLDIATLDSTIAIATLGDTSASNYGKAIKVTRNSGHGVTAVGDVCVSTTYSKFASGGSAFDGAGDYLTVEDSSDFDVGSGNFCIDFWFYPTLASRMGLLAWAADCRLAIDYHYNGTRNVNVWASSNGASWDLLTGDFGGNGVGSVSLVLNDWNHIAFVRMGNRWMSFINGALDVDTTVAGTVIYRNEVMRIGRWGAAIEYFITGYLDEYSFATGSARIDKAGDPLYISSGNPADGFTPPTGPYSTSYNTSQLGVQRDYYSLHSSQLTLQRSLQSIYYISEIRLSREWNEQKVSKLVVSRNWRAQQSSVLGMSRSWKVLYSSRLTVDRSWNELKSSLIKLRRHLFTGTNYRLYIHNISTGAVTLLGTFDGSYELNGIPVPDGSYELIVESDEGLYNNIRTVYAIGFSVGSGDVENIGLPLINNLTSERKAGFAKISWDITSTTETYIDGFYIWFDDSSPVDTSGTQDDTQPYFSGNNEYDYFYEQTEAKYIAIKPYSGATLGTVAELYLPWQTVSAGVPEYQFVPDTID